MWSARKTGIVWGLVATAFLVMAVGPVAGSFGRWQAGVMAVAGGVVVGLLAAWRAAAHREVGDTAARRATGPPRS